MTLGANKHKPHVYVIPEDDANRQIAAEFSLGLDSLRQLQVLQVAGGWREVFEVFSRDHLNKVRSDPNRFTVLLIDLDGNVGRIEEAASKVPTDIRDRVFILSTLTEPEDLKKALGSYQQIGSDLSKDCRDGTNKTWNNSLLKHNLSEITRMAAVRGIIFDA